MIPHSPFSYHLHCVFSNSFIQFEPLHWEYRQSCHHARLLSPSYGCLACLWVTSFSRIAALCECQLCTNMLCNRYLPVNVEDWSYFCGTCSIVCGCGTHCWDACPALFRPYLVFSCRWRWLKCYLQWLSQCRSASLLLARVLIRSRTGCGSSQRAGWSPLHKWRYRRRSVLSWTRRRGKHCRAACHEA